MKNHESPSQPSQVTIDEINAAMLPTANAHAEAMNTMDLVENDAKDERSQLGTAANEAVQPVLDDKSYVDQTLQGIEQDFHRDNAETELLGAAYEALAPVEAELTQELTDNEQAFDSLTEPLRAELSDHNIDILVAKWQTHEAQNNQPEANLAVSAARATYIANQNIPRATRSQLPENVSSQLSAIDAKAASINASYNEHVTETDAQDSVAYQKLKKRNTLRNVASLGFGSKKRALKLATLSSQQKWASHETHNQLLSYGAGLKNEVQAVVDAVVAEKVSTIDNLASQATQTELADTTFEATSKDLYAKIESRITDLYANYDTVVQEALENTRNDPDFATLSLDQKQSYLASTEHQIEMTYQARREVINLEGRIELNRALIKRLGETNGTNSRLDVEREASGIRFRTGGLLDESGLDNLRIRASHSGVVTKAPEIDTSSKIEALPQIMVES